MSLCNGQNSNSLIPASAYAPIIYMIYELVSWRIQMKEHQFNSNQYIRGWFEIGERSDGARLLPEQGAAANPYPLRGQG